MAESVDYDPSRSSLMATRIRAARAGSQQALGELGEDCRRFLLRIANSEIPEHLRPKTSGSDIVQQTLLEACRDFDQFRGETEEQLLAWLREILLCNLANTQRHYFGTAKRDLSREVPLEVSLANEGEAAFTGTVDLSPEHQAIERERSLRLQVAIEHLPPVMREVLVLHHQHGWSFHDIGERLDKSADAVRKLWVRAVKLLKTRLRTSDESATR